MIGGGGKAKGTIALGEALAIGGLRFANPPYDFSTICHGPAGWDRVRLRTMVRGTPALTPYFKYSRIFASNTRGLKGLVTYPSQPDSKAFLSSPLKA